MSKKRCVGNPVCTVNRFEFVKTVGVVANSARTCTVAGSVPAQIEKVTVPSTEDTPVAGDPQKLIPPSVLVRLAFTATPCTPAANESMTLKVTIDVFTPAEPV